MPSTSGDFVQHMEERLRCDGQDGFFHIEELLVVEDDSPERLKALGERYGTVYDEAVFYGAVHDTGHVELVIDNCYIVD